MRLFFALWPDEATRAALDTWGCALQAVCGGRRMRSENLHLTLAFLGSVPEERLREVEHAAACVAPRCFLLRLDQVGYWRHNRIAWAGTTQPPAALEALAAELRGSLARAGIACDDKPFAVHVTLLRQAHEPRRWPVLEPIAWETRGFALVRSITVSEGSRYEVRSRWEV